MSKKCFLFHFKYDRVQETEEETEARLKKWEAFLNTNKDSEDAKTNPTEARCDDPNGREVDSDGTRSSAGSDDETGDEGDHE